MNNQQKKKLSIVISIVWVIIALAIGYGVALDRKYPETGQFILIILALNIPIWLSWSIYWIWGKEPFSFVRNILRKNKRAIITWIILILILMLVTFAGQEYLKKTSSQPRDLLKNYKPRNLLKDYDYNTTIPGASARKKHLKLVTDPDILRLLNEEESAVPANQTSNVNSITFTDKELQELAKKDIKKYLNIMAAILKTQMGIDTGSGRTIAVFIVHNTLMQNVELPKGYGPRPLSKQINTVCSAQTLRNIIDNGGTYAVQYLSQSGEVVGYNEVKPGDCG